ncbi:RCC1 domain-containing protein 1 isoform X2 [Columba livia]|uniref:RCC1 domain-containing protein 1 isoform X2 n=1 Tax=Columba livia TaxID=8932 RepID=UPI0031BB8C36
MAVPRRSWLVFGFSPEEAAGEPELGPGPRRLESGPEGVRRVWPAWSYVVVETGAGLELRSAGLRRALPGWVEALPSETHLVLRGPAGARAWPRAAALRGELGVAPAWSRDPPPGSLEPRDPLPLLPGGFVIPRPPFFSALPAGLRARRLVLGCEHVLVLGAVGEIFTWGGGRHGQLGHGTLESEPQPRLLEALAGVAMRAVAAGGWHSASVSGDTEVTAHREQLAAEDTAFISIQAFPALLDLPQELEVSAVSCGSRHTAALTRDGQLYTWGWGKYGQLGHEDKASSDQPRRVEALVAAGLRVEEVTCGPWATYVCVLEP